MTAPGRVYLVGAGPGDPGLLTVRARELLECADVVLCDHLVGPEVRALAAGEVIDVGKVGGGPQVPQEDTEQLLVEHARAGRSVVRLKGGDPFVFGRGGEEAQTCLAHGIPFEVVPGVTAGVAAPASAGIPVTQRGMALGVAFVTGRDSDGNPPDLAALARFPGTLVFYMGIRGLAGIAEGLIAGGRPADEPCAIVERGTLPGQRVVRGSLAEIAERAESEGIQAPAVTVVGAVADLELLTRGPLAGRTIAVTRARPQASALASRLRALGAAVVEAPAIRVEPLNASLPDLAAHDLLVLTSPNGVRRLFELVRDARDLAGVRVAAIGPGTAAALRDGGIEPDVVPERAVAEGLVEALTGVEVRRALLVRGEEGREVLPEALRARGAQVDIVPVYRTVPEPLSEEVRAAALSADDLVFASASAARAFHAAAGTLEGPRIVSIGPATSEAIRALGFEPAVEAAEHTPDGLVTALLTAPSDRRVDT
ncbi:MAG: uroporphyrinogen methyltransferase / synthase [Solirubrobacteraceae bacterium]|nr:uroporphyrinogen methyltransferase / synthase [Solirubrobacteraceae bacterium]